MGKATNFSSPMFRAAILGSATCSGIDAPRAVQDALTGSAPCRVHQRPCRGLVSKQDICLAGKSGSVSGVSQVVVRVRAIVLAGDRVFELGHIVHRRARRVYGRLRGDQVRPDVDGQKGPVQEMPGHHPDAAQQKPQVSSVGRWRAHQVVATCESATRVTSGTSLCLWNGPIRRARPNIGGAVTSQRSPTIRRRSWPTLEGGWAGSGASCVWHDPSARGGTLGPEVDFSWLSSAPTLVGPGFSGLDAPRSMTTESHAVQIGSGNGERT